MTRPVRRSKAFRPEKNGTISAEIGTTDVNVSLLLPHFAEYVYIDNRAESDLYLNFGEECNPAKSMRIPMDQQMIIAWPYTEDMHMMRPAGASTEEVYITLGDYF